MSFLVGFLPCFSLNSLSKRTNLDRKSLAASSLSTIVEILFCQSENRIHANKNNPPTLESRKVTCLPLQDKVGPPGKVHTSFSSVLASLSHPCRLRRWKKSEPAPLPTEWPEWHWVIESPLPLPSSYTNLPPSPRNSFPRSSSNPFVPPPFLLCWRMHYLTLPPSFYIMFVGWQIG